jgi:hypothetical protein
MPLTRFPDHEDKRVFLSTVMSLGLAPPQGAHSGRTSIAVLWADAGMPAAAELNHDFAAELVRHRAFGVVVGGSDAERVAAIFDEVIAEADLPPEFDPEMEEIGVWSDPGWTMEDMLWTAAEEAMPPDVFAEHPWDIVVWARSDDPGIPRLRDLLRRLSALVDERYELGGLEDSEQ